MTLTIDLPPALEARLQAAAQSRGVQPEVIATTLLADHLPTVENAAPKERDPALVARVKSVRGRFAHTGALSSEELQRERQSDK